MVYGTQMTSEESSNQELYGPGKYREKWPDLHEILLRNLRKKCNRNLILNRFPIIKWFPEYNLQKLIDDMLAGITVGLTSIPQSMAYAVVAGFEPQYGLYSAFIPCFVYAIFGTCKDITIGPTGLMALLVQIHTKNSIDFAILATFLCGSIVFLMGLLNLGFLVQFISIPVTAGFTSAAAITIGFGQIKTILGIPGASNEFLQAWQNIIRYIGETKLWDTVLGVSTIIFLLLLKKLNELKIGWIKVRKYLAVSRYGIAVIFGIILAYTLTINGDCPFAITGTIRKGFPPIGLPPFSTVVNNSTIGFGEMVSSLGTTLITIPIVAILETIAITKAFSKGKTIAASQEMIAVGSCNAIGSFFSSMPVAVSFTRTAVNNASGVRTQFGGIFTGILVLLALNFLTDTFQYIPKPTLAGVIIAAMIGTVDFEKAIEIWKTKRIDIIPYMTTLLGCLLLGLDIGIGIGVATNILILLYLTSRPKIDIKAKTILNENILLITPYETVVYSAAEYIKETVLKYALKNRDEYSIIILDGQHIQSIDFTVVKNLYAVADDFHTLKIDVIFWNWKHSTIGVAWRLDRDFGSLFKNADTLEELIGDMKKSEEIVIT